jgi:CubicO group peptidase (beta-lactamase class C family)
MDADVELSTFTHGVIADPISEIRAGIPSRPRTDPLIIDSHSESGVLPATFIPRVGRRLRGSTERANIALLSAGATVRGRPRHPGHRDRVRSRGANETSTLRSAGAGAPVRRPLRPGCLIDGADGDFWRPDGPRKSFAGGAGLLSTARDYSRFLEMIRNDGVLDGVRILAPRTVALMRTNQVGSLHSPSGLGFGFGFETTDRVGANGLDPEGAYGWGGAYGSLYRVDPDANVVLLLMIQQLPNSTDIGQRFPALVQQALIDTHKH